jgi:hypothetical protein
MTTDPQFKHSQSGHAILNMAAFIAVMGALLMTFGHLSLSTGMLFVVWIAVLCVVIAAVIVHFMEAEEAAAKKKIEDKKSAQKSAERLKMREEAAAKEEAAREAMLKEDAARKEKEAEAQKQIIEQLQVKWADRVHTAAKREAESRAHTNHQDRAVRDAATQAASVWAAAGAQAKWSVQKILDLTSRPEVQSEARLEAKEAELQAQRTREEGRVWRESQAEALAELKKKAREEEKMVQARAEALKKEIKQMDMQWKGEVARAERLERDWKSRLEGK